MEVRRIKEREECSNEFQYNLKELNPWIGSPFFFCYIIYPEEGNKKEEPRSLLSLLLTSEEDMENLKKGAILDTNIKPYKEGRPSLYIVYWCQTSM